MPASVPTVNLLAAIASFIKVVETGSIVGAARNLGLSAAAVSQTLNRLEEHLGTRLLQRTTRRMALTENGALYYAKVRRIATDLEAAQMAIRTDDNELQGRLCIASTSAFGRHVVAPLIAGFAARYPRLALELCTSDGKINHIQDNIDLSLRIKPQLEDGIVARKIASVPVYCLRRAGRSGARRHPPHAGGPPAPCLPGFSLPPGRAAVALGVYSQWPARLRSLDLQRNQRRYRRAYANGHLWRRGGTPGRVPGGALPRIRPTDSAAQTQP